MRVACPGELELVDFAQGNLAVARRAALDSHVDSCPECRTAIVGLLSSSAGTGGATEPLDAKPGSRIGRFEVVEAIGRGGAGRVFAARDPDLDRVVALKVLHAENDSALSSDRLLREAQAAAKLAHPNVVAVHEVGVVPQGIFIAMERVVGSTLSTWLEKSRTRDEIIGALIQAGRGIEAAHRAGIVHRDVKPSNILVGTDKRVRVTDFGLAAAWDGSVASPSDASSPSKLPVGDVALALTLDATPVSTSTAVTSSSRARSTSMLDERLTQTGTFLGTPAYMAPEQFLAATVGPAADQFALAIVAYEALCGERPFAGATVPELADNVVQGRRRAWPTGRNVPGRIRGAIDRALSVEPTKRWPDISAFIAELELELRPSRKKWIAIAVAAGALGAGGAAFLAHGAAAPTTNCDDAGAGLEQVVTPDLGTRVHAALSDDPTSTVSAQITNELQRRGDKWRAMRVEACRAHAKGTESAELLDLRTLCLDQRRAELAALASRVTSGPMKSERAVKATFALPDLAACADVRGLRATVAPPADPQQRGQLAALEADLAALRLAADLGGDGSKEKAADVVARAKALGYQPILAEAELVAGRIARTGDDQASAEKALYEAIYAAEASHDDRRAVRAWIDLAVVTGIFQKKFDDGKRALRMAEASLTRLGEDHRLEAELAGTAGKLHLVAGEFDDAEKDLRRSLTLRETNLPDDLNARAVALNDLSVLLKQRAELTKARELQVAAKDLDIKLYGEQHAKVATDLNNIAELDRMQGKYAEAEAGYKAALAIQEKTLGPDHTETMRTVGNLGLLMRDKGDCPGSIPWNQRAVEGWKKLNSPGDAGMVLHNMGLCLAEDKKTFPDALAMYEQALAEKRKVYPEDHPSMAVTLDAEGYVLGQLERYDEALDHYAKARGIDIKRLGENHPDVAYDWQHVGELELARHRPAAALEPLLKNVKILDAFADADPLDKAGAHQHYAVALWDSGKHADGFAEMTKAKDIVAALPDGKDKTDGFAELDDWFAKHKL
ncbi:MAG TPA: serine/threonine-protein kinase [Kofleriaceae bacterium]|jgi:tetratricopeptide (TPR) repeat protein/predicted Ser/Thr protein kinase